MTNNLVCEVTKDSVCKMIKMCAHTAIGTPATKAMHKLQLKLLQVIKWSNMSVTNLSFSTKFGTLCFDIVPGKERRRENTGGTGGTGGSGGGRKSKRRRRKRMAAQRDDAFSTTGSEDSASSVSTISKEPATGSSGYSSIASDTSDQAMHGGQFLHCDPPGVLELPNQFAVIPHS